LTAEQQESDEPSRQRAQSARHEHDASPRETVGVDAADQQDRVKSSTAKVSATGTRALPNVPDPAVHYGLVALGGALRVFGAVEILQLPGPPS
jgi:hypothetical protein